jgi:hypothetical protein
MEIDNSKVVVRDRKLMYIMAISLILCITFIMLTDYFDNPIFGISRDIYALSLATIYVLINVYRFILDLNFLSFSLQGEKIIIHYYSLRPFMQKHRSIEIPVKNLIKFEVKKSFLELKKQIIFYQRVNNKSAKYPPISISALNKQEYSDLISSLNSLTKTN